MTDAPLSVNLSESALQILQEGPAPGETSTGIARIAIAGRRSGEFQYDFEQIISSDVRDDDVPVEFEGLKFYVEASSAASLEGATIDYVTDKLGRSGFTVDNPNPLWPDESHQKVAELIESDINPAIAMHGGAIELVDYAPPRIQIRMTGGCQGCASSTATLKNGIEIILKESFPEIEEIDDVTDHSEGENPYM
jgi:Fe/S biogenesis protein NfuA